MPPSLARRLPLCLLLAATGLSTLACGGDEPTPEPTAAPTAVVPTVAPTAVERPTEAPTEIPTPTETPTVAASSTPVVVVVTATSAPTVVLPPTQTTPSPAPTQAGVFELWCDPCQLDDDTTCGAVRWRIVGVKEASIEHDGKTQGATGPEGSIGNVCLQPGDKSTYTMNVVWPDGKTESKSVTLEREK